MKPTLNLLMIGVLILGAAAISSAQRSPAMGDGSTGIATLFARDPLTQSLCFQDGGPGNVFQNGATRNRCSDLNFHSYTANGFRVGVEGGRDGVILDLGTPEALKATYGFAETVSGGQGFASIDVKSGKALILKDSATGSLQELAGTAALFSKPSATSSSVPVNLGHVYLLRITDRRDPAFEMFAKVLVLSYVPGESVTIRWLKL